MNTPDKKRGKLGDMPCPVARTLDKVGHWWSLLIVRNAFYGQSRFKQFHYSLGMSRNMLAARLQLLTDEGILEKIPDRQGSKYPEYILTTKGTDLMPVLIALGQWGNKWAAPEAGPALEMVDKRTGNTIPPQDIRNANGEKIPLSHIGTRPGPGARQFSQEKN